MQCVVYLRVSTDEQSESGLGLEAQTRACRLWAERSGWTVKGEFRDEGLSGGLTIEKRTGLLDAIAYLDRGDSLLVAKLDRLSRGDPLQNAMIEAAVARKGARIVSAAGEGTEGNDPTNILMRRMVQAFAEYEKLLIGHRTRSALRVKRQLGERVGRVPYGRRLGSKVRRGTKEVQLLDVDQAELELLGRIARRRAEGISVRGIAAELNRDAIPTKFGRPWAPSTVHDLLRRIEREQSEAQANSSQ